MKILKRILLAIGILVALLLVIALFVKKDYAVERSVSINKPKQEVFDYLKFLKNQDNFSVWMKLDPNTKKEYQGTDGTVGFISAWDSENKNVGKGVQEIKKITDGERIDSQIHFIKPFDGLAQAYMATQAEADTQTKVTWGFKSEMAYPMNLMLLFMDMDKILGKDLEEGLRNLKDIQEKK